MLRNKNPVNWMITKSREAALNNTERVMIISSLTQQDPYHVRKDIDSSQKRSENGFVMGESKVGEDKL